MINRDHSIKLPDDTYRLIRDLIADYCGVFYDDDSRYIFERRLNRRLSLKGMNDFRDYYRYLLYNHDREEEMSSLVDILTVNETYFFREKRQFDALVEEIVPEMVRDGRERIRIWSAGCASGEEPYTIAMYVLENPRVFSGMKVEILGSDINKRVLHKARNGVFTQNSFRATDQRYIHKYFDQEGKDFRISDKVRELVDFSHMNLLDPIKAASVGEMDIIFCRNVMIYFHPQAKHGVVDIFHTRLREGGYLLLGHAESLINISSSFALKHLKNDMVYQKPRRPEMGISNENLYRMVWGS